MAAIRQSDLNVDVKGDPNSGLTPAIFIHDFMTDTRLFDKVLKEGSSLLSNATCACYDLRGFGLSPIPTQPYSRLDDVAAVHASAGTAPAHMLGCGLGGTIALEYALAYPERVRSVSLISSGLPGHDWQRGRNTYFIVPPVAEGRVANDGEIAAGLELARAWTEQSPEWKQLIRKGGPNAELLQTMLGDYSGFHFWGEDQLDPDPCSGDPLSMRIGGVQPPVLAMVGAEEMKSDFGAIGHEIVKGVQRVAFNDRRVHVLDGAGHFGTLESPVSCIELVSRFWMSTEHQ
jgi:3-oxoadipate enol-lactonase